MAVTSALDQPSGAARAASAGPSFAVVTGTLGVVAASWVLAIDQMRGMDEGVATTLASFGSFAGSWIAMMVAMMLPGAIPGVLRGSRDSGHPLAAPSFGAQYIAVWAVMAVVVYSVYRPHGTVAAGVVVIAAALYELTPIKRRCRDRCRRTTSSGLVFGLNCVGSSAGLMAILVVMGVMSVTWMVAVAAVIASQKLLRRRAVVDVPLALVIGGLGVVILTAPSLIPGLAPTAGPVPMM